MWAAFERAQAAVLQQAILCRRHGRLTSVQGLVLEATGLDVRVGELVDVIPAHGGEAVTTEVVGLSSERVVLMPFGPVDGLCLDSDVVARGEAYVVAVGDALLGRILDARGLPLDGLPWPSDLARMRCIVSPINPLRRTPINTPLVTGVKAVDVFLPLGRGQRMGIFAGSGVGKSTLLGMLSQHTEADVIVIALIGERGREVGDFIRDSLGSNGLRKAVVVAASAEQPAVLRRQAAYTATTIAEAFRAKGKHVLLLMDSLTRLALAQREIGLSTGEPMGSRGYPPSVFALMPPLIERAGGIADQGSITGIYTVLVDGDDINEPVADHLRAMLDGHIVLSREAASRGHFPAIDVLQSISRLANALRTPAQRQLVDCLRSGLGIFLQSKDMIELGAYQHGSHPVLDKMIALKPQMDALLMQRPEEYVSPEKAWRMVHHLAQHLGQGERS